MSDPALAQIKARARDDARARLRSLTPAQRAGHSRAICAHARSWDVLESAGTIMLYVATELEPDLRALHASLAGSGKTLCVPSVDWQGGTMHARAVCDWDADLGPAVRGVREPLGHTGAVERGAIELVLVPGVAFDRTGGRLGRGGGFFDRFLAGLSPRTHLAGVCFGVQLIESVPRDSEDVAVGWVITEAGVDRAV